MASWRMRFLQVMVVWSLTASCLEPTQVSFEISTDVPCDSVGTTAVTVGLEGQTEKAEPTALTTRCTANGTIGAIGTYAAHPRTQGPVTASFKVVMAVDPSVEVADCTPTQGYRGCIVARRRLSFVPHQTRTVRVEMLLICKGVQCDENTTCNRLGRCVTSAVDTDACDDAGSCNTPLVVPGTGLKCFDTPGEERLLCGGETPWCTGDGVGSRACASAPLSDGGLSYECRTARDCGPHFLCRRGAGAILGECLNLDLLPPDVVPVFRNVVCQPDDARACPGGASDCSEPATLGFMLCKSTVTCTPPPGAHVCP